MPKPMQSPTSPSGSELPSRKVTERYTDSYPPTTRRRRDVNLPFPLRGGSARSAGEGSAPAPVRFCLALAACLLSFISGCVNLPQHKVEDMITASLPSVLGPADDYQTHVTGHWDSILRGHVKEITVHGDNVQMSHYITVQTIDIDCQDISVDTNSHEIQSLGPFTFVITINQAAVDRYLLLTSDEVNDRPPDLRVQLRQKDINVSCAEKVIEEKIPMSVSGVLRLSAPGSNKLNFIPNRASVLKVKLPEKLVRYAMSRVNPVIDLTQTTVPITVTGVDAHDDLITVSGTIDLTPADINKAIERSSEQHT